MRYKLCLFDFDYTLVDTTKPIVESFRYTFEKENLDVFDREKVIKTIGMTLDNAFMLLTGIKDKEQIEKLKKIYRAKSDEVTVQNTVLFDNTIDTLKSLKEKNIKIGIVSSRMGSRIDVILRHLNCREYVDYIVGYENVSTHKPNPEGLNKAIEHFKYRKDEVLYVGDSYIDAGAAENGKIDFVGVTTGTTSEDDFKKYNNIKIAENLSEILQIIE